MAAKVKVTSFTTVSHKIGAVDGMEDVDTLLNFNRECDRRVNEGWQPYGNLIQSEVIDYNINTGNSTYSTRLSMCFVKVE